MKKKGKLISCILALTLTTSMGNAIPTFAEVATPVSESVSASHRLAGINRYATAVVISQKGWSTSDTVILASGEDYADALTSGPLAKKYNAPILLTSKASISAETISEIGRLKAKNIILIGGEGAISLGVATQLTKAGFSGITRIGGVNRYETSTMVAAKLDKPSAVVIVPGQNFPDALSISSIASNLGLPIILSSKSSLSDSAKSYISTNGITKAYIVGGLAVLSPTIETQVTSPVRLAGINRYETNLAVLKAFDGKFNYDNVFIATGNNFADALAGTALASKTSSPIILAGSIMYANTANYLASKENLNTKILALGGEAIISNSIVASAIDAKATIAVTKNYSSAGTYSAGDISGSVIISETGVNLKNTTISGDLLIASTVREGNVDLDNVTVTGKIIINGGGVNSIKLHNMHSKLVEIDKATGESVRVVTDATSSIDTVLLSSNGIVDQTSASKKGHIIIDNNSSVVLKGGFDTVQVNGHGSIIKLVNASIVTLNVNATSSNTIVDANSTITNLNVNAAVTVSGTGKITNANIGANGTTISITPGVTSVTAGVSVLVNGITKDSTNSPVITSVPVGGETPIPVPPVIPGIPGMPGIPTVPVVSVSTITVTGAANATTVVVGETLKMSAAVTPANATNQTIAWTVATIAGGIATINSTTGLLTASGVGTVRVTATNAASGVVGIKDITVVAPINNYTALGDSITYGMSAEKGLGYTDLFYNYLNNNGNEGIKLLNLGIPGEKSSDLLSKLQSDETTKDAVMKAKVITISVGGNNLLSPVINALATAFQLDPRSPSFATDLALALNNPNNQATLNAIMAGKLPSDLMSGAQQFSTDWLGIIGTIKMLAPNAEVYATTLYNPLNQLDPLYNVFDPAIRGINAIIKMPNAGYKVADVYTAFHDYKGTEPLTGFSLFTGNLDPHPTTKGHEVIYQCHIDAKEIIGVSSITVTGAANATTVVVGETLQMSAAVTPVNATNQTIAWSVATILGGAATIDSSTGLLTATEIGTVSVIATNAASGIKGTKVITITQSPAELALQATAETAVLEYESAPITTLAEVATAEGLKVAADTAVAAVGNAIAKTAFELRVTNRAAAIASAKTTLLEAASQATAETAVMAYESAPITTLTEVATAEGLKAAADTAVAAVGNVLVKITFELRVTNRSIAISIAKATLEQAALQATAEAAVVAYESAPISNLVEISSAEGLKTVADLAVAAVLDVDFKSALVIRITSREAQIAAAKLVLIQFEADAQAAANTAITAFEAAPLTNIAQINVATGLKNTADAKVATVGNTTAKATFTQRIAIKTTAMAIAETNLDSFFGSIGVLIKHNMILGLDFTDYNSLSNKAPVLTAMSTSVFITVNDIKTAFDAAVAMQKLQESSIVSAFNNATDSNAMASAITTYAASLSLVLTEYNAITNKTPIYTELIGRTFLTGEQVKVAFIIAVMNNTTVAGVKTLLSSNSVILGLALNSEYTSLSTKNLIEAAVTAARPIADKLEIVVTAFNSTSLRGYIGQLIPINKVLLGLDLTDYDSLTNLNKLGVQDALLAATLGTKADVQSIFNTSVAALKASEALGVAAFNNATDASAIATAITTYIPGTDLGNYTSLANKVPVQTALLMQVFSSMNQIQLALNNAVADQKIVENLAMTALNNAVTPEAMDTAITIYGITLGLDLTDYSSFSSADKVPVQTAMITPTFYIVSILKTTFDSAVASQKVVIAINNADATTIGSMITNNAAALGLNINDYNLLTSPSKDIVHVALVGKAFADKAAVNLAFETAVSVPIINEILSQAAMSTALYRYATVLGLNLTDYGALFAPYNAVVLTAMLTPTFASAAEVKITFDTAVAEQKVAKAVVAVNAAATTAAMNTTLVANATVLGINLSDYNSLVSKTSVQTAMLTPVFLTGVEVKTAFNSAVAVQKINEVTFNGMGLALTTNASVLGLDLTDYNALLNKEPVHTVMDSSIFANAVEVKTAFDIAVGEQKAIEAPILSVPSVIVNKSAISLSTGASEVLIATVLPIDAVNKDVVWTSSNPAVATVDATGVVSALSAGTAVITATSVDGGYTDTCTVTVIVQATGVTLNKVITFILVGSNETLVATVLPINATNKNLIWTSDTPRATVDNTGKVTGVSSGVGSNITVKTVDGNFTAVCYVSVLTETTIVTNIRNGAYLPNVTYPGIGTFVEYASALGINFTDYNALGEYEQGEIQAALKNPAITTALQLKTAFYTAVALQEINLATIESMGPAIVKNAAHLGLDLTAYTQLVNKDIVHVSLGNLLLLQGPFAAAEDIIVAFDLAVADAPAMEVAISEINAATIETMDAAITSNAVILGLDLTSYDAYADKASIHAAMITAVFTNQMEVQTAIDIFSAKSITVFDFNELTAVGVIDEINHEVWIGVPFGTDLTALVPTIVHNGISISPDPLAPADFSSPFIYTVTAADGSTQDWTVYVY